MGRDVASLKGRKIFLLDAMALAYRAHFIFINRPLVNSKGQTTSAAYGFTSALLKLIEDHKIKDVAVVFDVMEEGGTFRDELYEDYKATRDPPPKELLANIPLIKAVVDAFGILILEQGGVEADDVIGTICKQAEERGGECVIVSPDKDFKQLLSPGVTLFRPAYRGEEFDPHTDKSFREQYGVGPERFTDILALMGDSADNVPGVPGIGEKTATKLVQEYGDIESIIEHAADLKGKKAREGMLMHAEDARLSKQLVTIKTDVPLDFSWQDLELSVPELDTIRRIFDELEFHTIRDRTERILGNKPPIGTGKHQADLFASDDDGASPQNYAVADASFDAETVDYSFIKTKSDLKVLVDGLASSNAISFDTETTDRDAMWASLVGISITDRAEYARYIPVPLADGTNLEVIAKALQPLFESDTLKLGQNLKYDILVLQRHGISVNGPLFDTLIAHYLIAPEEPHNLDSLALKYFGYKTMTFESIVGTGKDAVSIRDVPLDKVSDYACEDADIVFRLHEKLRDQLIKNDLLEIAEEIEFPLIPVLARMESTGIRVDEKILADISKQMELDIASLQQQIFSVAGREFNIGSPAQLAEILFDELKLPVISKTSKGKASTKESVLRELATEHELPALILDWRQLAKLKNTYVDTLPKLVHPETGRIHTQYNQIVAATGRLSSQNPNLQNIPIRTDRGREIRSAFVPEEKWKLLSADYVQIELRILASMSGDQALMDAFESGEDIHTSTASRVFGIDRAEVTRAQRSKAKEVNYGIPYGISAFGLALRLRCPRAEARDLIDSYKRSYPEVTRFLHEQVVKAREHGYSETLLGRRRYVPAINARNRNERSAAERIAVNMPIQGSQADMIKIAMINLSERLNAENLEARLLLQVHDELVLECPPDEMEQVMAMVKDEMTNALPLEVPIDVEVQAGGNWMEAH